MSSTEELQKPKLSVLRVLSWLAVFASPILIALYSITRPKIAPCSSMGCMGTGLGELILLIAIYAIFLLIAAVLNFIDYLRTRKTASVWRHIEVIIWTSPVWLWLLAIPHGINHLIEQKHYQALEPFAEIIIEHHDDASYSQLKTAIEKVALASDETKNQFSMLDYYVGDAQLRINKIDIIRENKTRKLSDSFFIKPFTLCISDAGIAASQEPWRILSYSSALDDYKDMQVLSDRNAIQRGITDQNGCSKVRTTQELTEAIKNGETPLMIVGTEVLFLEIDSDSSQLKQNSEVSKSLYSINIKELTHR